MQTQMEANSLTWLHFSDFQIGSSSKDAALDGFLKDVSRLVQKEGLRPDLIFFTGDLTFSKKKDQFELTRDFFTKLLDITEVEPDRLFLVPGNHDLDRSRLGAMSSSVGPQGAAGLEDYFAFASSLDRSFVSRLLDRSPQLQAHLPYVAQLKRNERSIAVLGLNTAWMSEEEGDIPGIDRELAGREIDAALSQLGDAGVRIALLHHPLEYLSRREMGGSVQRLLESCDFILHSHQGKGNPVLPMTMGPGAVVINGGSHPFIPDHPNSYNWVRVGFDQARVTIHLRRHAQGGAWLPDNATPDPDGTVVLSLPPRLGSQGAAAPGSEADAPGDTQREQLTADYSKRLADWREARRKVWDDRATSKEREDLITEVLKLEIQLSALRERAQRIGILDQLEVLDMESLRRNLMQSFSIEELKSLCFDLGIDYDDLEGDSKSDKCRSLLLFIWRQKRVGELIGHLQKQRPNVMWNFVEVQAPLPPAKANFGVDELVKILTERFDLSEIRDLCFGLGVDYEDLPREKGRMIEALVKRYSDSHRLGELSDQIARARPDVMNWAGGISDEAKPLTDEAKPPSGEARPPTAEVKPPTPDVAAAPPPTLSSDARIWFVSANPDEGTDWDKLFEQGKAVHWTEVRNPVGQRNIELTRAGDLVLAYSSAGRQEIIGLARISQDPDEQTDGRWAAWIEPLVRLERGVSLEELKKVTPDLAHVRNPMSSFSPVTPSQWRAVRGLLAERNPAQQGQLPLFPDDAIPALSWSPPGFSGDLPPGGRTTVQYALSNSGKVTFRRHEPLTLEATWRPVEQAADRKPGKLQNWSVRFFDDVPPGASLPVTDLGLELPDAVGSYEVDWLARADNWGRDMTPATITSSVEISAPPTLRYDLIVEAVEVAPPEAEPGAALHVKLSLRNSGDIAWESADVLNVALAWMDADGKPLAEQPEPQQPRVDASVPAGKATTLALAEITAPMRPGEYKLKVTVGQASWGVERTAPASTLTVREPKPPFAAGLALDRQPASTLWPGERFEVAGQASNSGTQAWVKQQVQVDAMVVGPEPARADRLRGSPQWLQAAAPGGPAVFELSGVAPITPGQYTLAVVVGKVDPGQPPAELARGEAAFAVRDLATLGLPELTDEAPAGLPASVQAQRLREIGGRLADPAADAQQRDSVIQEHLLPGLWSAEAQVSRAALGALFTLRTQDEGIDKTVRAGIAERGGNLGALPDLLRSSTDAPVDASLAWLDGLLPRPAPVAVDEKGRQVVFMPLTVLAEPTLTAPHESHTAVVTIEPSKVTQRSGQMIVEPGRVTLGYGGSTFVSRNPMGNAEWQTSLARAEDTSPRAYGEFLFNTIFNTDKLDIHDSTYNGYVIASNDAKHRLRLELVFASEEVGSHRWEYLRNSNDRAYNEPAPPLAVYSDSPLYRFSGDDKTSGPVSAKPLRILVAICNPSALDPRNKGTVQGVPGWVQLLTDLKVEAEVQAVEPALQRLQDELGIAEYQILGRPGDDPVTFDRLVQTLKGRWHVLHIISHGVQSPDGRYFLVMEPDKTAGQPIDLVAPDRFETPQFNNLRLVVLSSCQSAQRERPAQKVLPSLAERLLGRGVPAVIAMQGLIKIEADQLFAQRFYEDLARSGKIDMAVASARYDLYHYKPERWDWGMPVLYMSTHDGTLFEVDPALAANAARDRSESSELKKLIKPASQLFSDPDLAERVINNSLQGYAQSLGVDAQQVSRLAAAIASQMGGAAPRSAPLAKRQERQGWTVGPVQIDGKALADFVRDDPRNPMEIPDRVFHQVAAALNVGKHIVLTGAPGTGKTSLAEAICSYAKDHSNNAVRGYRMATATADWTTFDTVGGFVPLESGALQFRPGILLEAIREGNWIIVDEINRAEIDKAFGELFTVLSGQQVTLAHTIDGQPVRILPPARSGRWDQDAGEANYDYVVHPSWRIVGTMNVYDKSYLFNMSFAFMRRFAFVDVDLPDSDKYQDLIEGWLKATSLAKPPTGQVDSPGRTEFLAALGSLLNPESRLMKRRAIGPAIVKDVMRYMQNRMSAGDETKQAVALGYLAEAFQLYAAPQLDSLDEPGILGIYEEIDQAFKPLLASPLVEHGPLHRLSLQRIRQMYPHIPEDEWKAHLSPQALGASPGS